jgi:hypothetical protein
MATHALAMGQNTLAAPGQLRGDDVPAVLLAARRPASCRAWCANRCRCSAATRSYLLHKFSTVVRATVKGTWWWRIVQGILGGLALWVLGIGGAVCGAW